MYAALASSRPPTANNDHRANIYIQSSNAEKLYFHVATITDTTTCGALARAIYLAHTGKGVNRIAGKEKKRNEKRERKNRELYNAGGKCISSSSDLRTSAREPYIYRYIHTHMHLYMCTCVEKLRERERADVYLAGCWGCFGQWSIDTYVRERASERALYCRAARRAGKMSSERRAAHALLERWIFLFFFYLEKDIFTWACVLWFSMKSFSKLFYWYFVVYLYARLIDFIVSVRRIKTGRKMFTTVWESNIVFLFYIDSRFYYHFSNLYILFAIWTDILDFLHFSFAAEL